MDSVIMQMQRPLFYFIWTAFKKWQSKWSVQLSLICEVWLCWLQPWKIKKAKFSSAWIGWIKQYLPFYTTLLMDFLHLLKRIEMRGASEHGSDHLRMLDLVDQILSAFTEKGSDEGGRSLLNCIHELDQEKQRQCPLLLILLKHLMFSNFFVDHR